MRKVLVLIAAVALVAAFAAPALAAEWGFYGSARMTTFWDDLDAQASGLGFDDDDVTWALQGNSRIGANVKAGDITGRFEYGTGVNLRLLYAEYDFGSWRLLLGQTYGPVNIFISNQVWGGDTDMLPYGGVYGGRNPMIRVRFPNINLDIAGLSMSTNTANLNVGFADTDTSIPKLEARWNHTWGAVFVELGAGYNTFDIVDAFDNSESIDSYILAGAIKVNLGAFYANADIYVGQNLGNYGIWVGAADAGAKVDPATGQAADTDGFGWLIVLGYKVSDMLTFEGGYGMAEHESDLPALTTEDDQAAWYVQAVINIAKGFFHRPGSWRS
jgi:hypothetical protein